MNKKQLIAKAKEYVSKRFSEKQRTEMVYHNLDHTLYVAKAANKIGKDYPLSKDQRLSLKIAALFHDVGALEQIDGHEEIGVGIMRTFLEKEKVHEEIIKQVSALILATRLPQQPSGLLEEIICDADLYHLGKKSFFEKCELLKLERENLLKKQINDKDWLSRTLVFMEKHRYRTVYCISTLYAGKSANITLLNDKIKREQSEKRKTTVPAMERRDESHTARDSGRPDKGIETMFRITSSNNQRMSDMADNKAHIMITVNSIILSAIISIALRKLEDNTYLTYPTFLLLAVSIVAMTFSILATRPSIPRGTYTQNDLDLKQVNLLFFGNFYKMPLERYSNGMMKIMDDRDFLYQTLIKDIHGQGTVLGKKYRFLRIAYNIFMYGLILSVGAFIFVTFLRHE